MNETFDDLSGIAQRDYGEAFAPDEGGSFSIAAEMGAVEFIHAAGEPAAAVVRAKVLDLAGIPRAGDFAKAALAGNFFWSGTRGATLSIGSDNALWLTERRPLDELCDGDGLAQCIGDFQDTVSDWRERSSLYE